MGIYQTIGRCVKMAELNALIKERKELLAKIHHIEHDYEGLENEDNAKRSIELTMQKTELLEKEKSLTSQLSFLKTQI